MTLEGWTVVKEQVDRLDAENVRAFLQSNGIEAEVHSDDAGGTIPSLEESQGVQVLVKTADADAARRLIAQIARQGSPGGDAPSDGTGAGGDGAGGSEE